MNISRGCVSCLTQKALLTRFCSSKAAQTVTQPETSSTAQVTSNIEKVFPDIPTTCCMSGCANCVWLEYAEKLTEYFRDGGEMALKEINEKVTDNNIKAFLLHELRMRMKS